MPKKKEEKVEEVVADVATEVVEEKPKKKAAKKTKEVESTEEVVEAVEVTAEDDVVEEKVHKSHKPNVKKNPHGKKYKAVEGLIDKNKEYELDEAIGLLKKTATTKFDSSVEIHMNLNLDLTNPEHQIRGSVSMPAGLGKAKRVCAIVGAEKEKEAKDAGADTVGGQDIIEKIEKGWLDFDVVVATPDMMPHIGKIGKTLGTKGLMPNPKTGTVTPEPGKAITEIKKGKADYRVDKTGTVHAAVGKVSFDDAKIKENIETFIEAIHRAKPNSTKGTYLVSIFLTTTMGPSVRLIK